MTFGTHQAEALERLAARTRVRDEAMVTPGSSYRDLDPSLRSPPPFSINFVCFFKTFSSD